MTAEEFLEQVDKSDNDISSIIEKAMTGFAELKCKELLKIVAEKAKIKDEDNDTYEQPHIFYCNGEEYKTWVDKDSILNAVDLKEFIK
jgi:hypothetical protein